MLVLNPVQAQSTHSTEHLEGLNAPGIDPDQHLPANANCLGLTGNKSCLQEQSPATLTTAPTPISSVSAKRHPNPPEWREALKWHKRDHAMVSSVPRIDPDQHLPDSTSCLCRAGNMASSKGHPTASPILVPEPIPNVDMKRKLESQAGRSRLKLRKQDHIPSALRQTTLPIVRLDKPMVK